MLSRLLTQCSWRHKAQNIISLQLFSLLSLQFDISIALYEPKISLTQDYLRLSLSRRHPSVSRLRQDLQRCSRLNLSRQEKRPCFLKNYIIVPNDNECSRIYLGYKFSCLQIIFARYFWFKSVIWYSLFVLGSQSTIVVILTLTLNSLPRLRR